MSANRHPWAALPVLLFFLCGGCGGPALNHDYAAYSDVYAQAVNRQLLLNLARLSHDEPAYFLQLGSISSQTKVDAAVGVTPSHVHAIVPNQKTGAAFVAPSLTIGSSLTGSFEETPIFQFLPLNGASFAQTIATPIAEKVIHSFYSQGYHADTLFRVTVASVEVTLANSDHVYLVNEPMDPSYPQFLEFCAMMREAQLQHAVASKPGDPENLVVPPAALHDVVYAKSAGVGLQYDQVKNTYSLHAQAETPAFVGDAVWMKAHAGDPVAKLASMFNEKKVTLHTRTFEAVMYSVAKEELYFDWNFGRDTHHGQPASDWLGRPSPTASFSADAYGPIAMVRRDGRAVLTVRPVLQLRHPYPETGYVRASELASVVHDGQVYAVRDLEAYGKNGMPVEPPVHTYNRTAFTMISYLFSEVSIDTQKLPTQQFIQVQ